MDSPNKYVRSYAGIALARINETRALAPLIHALKDNDSLVRSRAISALEGINDSRVSNALILVLGKDENPRVRANAAGALGYLKDTQAVAPLIQALEDNDSDVQYAANDSLQKLGWHQE